MTTSNNIINIGGRLPDLNLSMTGEHAFNATSYAGKKLVIYFYPKDATPGCTIEGHDFTRLLPDFVKAGCHVFGVSKDSLKKHENFKAKENFQFELISDPDEVLCNMLGVIQLKKLYGKEYMGIDRSTFVFDEQHTLVKEWRKVKVANHAEEVLAFVQSI